MISQKGFDPDAEVSPVFTEGLKTERDKEKCDTDTVQDDSGWTPLMIAASVKDSDRVLDILLARGADVNQTST